LTKSRKAPHLVVATSDEIQSHGSSRASSTTDGIVHPERFDPHGAAGTLIDSEHRGRYWWASRLVAAKDVLDAGCGVGYGIEILASAGAAGVTGVDIDPAAVEEAQRRFGERADAIAQGDLHDLQLDDDSFDVVVCFETIEHLENGERALAEFRRVLRPDGLLLVSSPNPDVYPAGNEHHVHEYRPAELAAAVGEHFAYVTSYRQDAWLASVIEPAADGIGSAVGEWREPWEIRRTTALEAGGETFGIIVAGDERLPTLADVVALGSTFEVGWWSKQVANGKREAEKAAKEARRKIRRAKSEARESIAAAEAEAQQQVEAAAAQAEAAKSDAREAIAAAEEIARQQIEAAKSDAREAIAAAEKNAHQRVEAVAEQIEAAKSDAREATAAAEKNAHQEAQAAAEQIEAAKSEAREAIAAVEARAQQQVEVATEQVEAAKSEAREAAAAAEARAAESLQEAENRAHHAVAQAAEREAAVVKRLRETAAALLDANQELAQIPLLKHRLADLHEEHAQIWGRFNEIEGSRSWRLTAPLRRLWLVLGLRR
jgi:2-polyprenyl-3-methyl-5-hydroxy-6-metoxy-1,4-benzoquinol methylase